MSLWLGTLGASGLISGGDFESISTFTAPSGGVSQINFNTIPLKFTHLQIRILAKTNRSTVPGDYIKLRFNDVSTSIYSAHFMGTDIGAITFGGNVTYSTNSVNTDGVTLNSLATSAHEASLFSPMILDIQNFSSTAKKATLTYVGGTDNGVSSPSGQPGGPGDYINNYVARGVYIGSGMINSTEAITKISLFPLVGSVFSEHSTFALYGRST